MKKECTPLNDCVFVYREKNTKDEVKVGDNKLFIDTSWYEYDHVIQHATVKYVPKRISSYFKTEMELAPGDKVYCHHFIADEKNMIEIHGEKLSRLNYGMLYARVRDGKVHMLSDWVLVEIIKDKEEELKSESGIWLKTKEEKKEQIGKVKYVNSKSIDDGFKPGDTIMFIKDADYEMEIEGQKLYRMRNQDILAKVDKDSLPEAVDHVYKDNHQTDLPTFDEYNQKMQ
jgi:co-chaperonin GroES (HSP10)